VAQFFGVAWLNFLALRPRDPLYELRKGISTVNGRYVEDENGERVAVLLDIEDYERIIAQHHAPAAEDELPNDEDEVLDPEEAERRITEFVTRADDLPGPPVALAQHEPPRRLVVRDSRRCPRTGTH
jgi:hypothetical protein